MTITYQNLFPVAIGSTFLERDFTQTEIEFFNDQKNSLRLTLAIEQVQIAIFLKMKY
jgi:hypothetical protein